MLLNSVLHWSSSLADVNFTAFTWPSCLARSTASLERTSCDLSVVSDLKKARTPCCCRQRRSCSDRPLTYGKTAVDLNSVAGSALVFGFLVLVSLKERNRITIRNKNR